MTQDMHNVSMLNTHGYELIKTHCAM